MRIAEMRKRTAISFEAVAEVLSVHHFTVAVLVIFLCFIAPSSGFSSPVLLTAESDLVIKNGSVAETHNIKLPLSLALNGRPHVELPITLSAPSPFPQIPQEINETETSLTTEIQNQPWTEVKDTDINMSEHYQLATSSSKSRSVFGGLWAWILRLILMCVFLMVGEDSMGTAQPEPEEGKEEKPATSRDNVVGKETAQEGSEPEKKPGQEGIANLRTEEQEEEGKAHRTKIEGMLGGPTKVYEYFRDEVFMKKCQEENRNFSEAEAMEAWRMIGESERTRLAEEAWTKFLRCDEKLEDFLPPESDV